MLVDARRSIGFREAAQAAYTTIARNFSVEPELRPWLGANKKG